MEMYMRDKLELTDTMVVETCPMYTLCILKYMVCLCIVVTGKPISMKSGTELTRRQPVVCKSV